MAKSNRRLSLRLTLILALIAIVPLSLSGIGVTIGAFSWGEQVVEDQQEQMVTLAGTLISEYIANIQGDLSLMGQLSFDDPEFDHVLRAACERNAGLYNELAVVDASGKELSRVVDCKPIAVTMLRDVSSTEAFFKARRGPFISGVSFLGDAEDEKTPLVWMSLPVTGTAGLRVVMARVDLSELWKPILNPEAMGAAATLNGGYFYIVGSDGKLVGYQDSDLVRQNLNLEQYPTVNNLSETTDKVLRVVYNGLRQERVVGSSYRVPDVGWSVVIEQPVAEAYRLQYNVMYGFSVLIVLAVVAGTTAAVLISRSIVRPIQNLAEAALAVTQGNLTYEIDIRSDDELGAVGRAFSAMTQQLRQLIADLERKVAERTQALEDRSSLLEKTARAAREVAQIHGLTQLPEQTVKLISRRFGFYHVGMFFIDGTREYATMVAASSEGGKKMVARGHRRKMGEGIVGHVASTGEPRIALDVGGDTVWVKSVDLPDTRSEMALPLKSGDRVIGVLDVQSEIEAAFSDEDVAILTTLAEQVTLAIENARLLDESERSRQELEAFYGRQVASAWQERAMRQISAYFYNRIGVEPVSTVRAEEMMGEALGSMEYDRESIQILSPHRLLAPIRLRDQVIGSLLLERAPDRGVWGAEEIAMVETLTAQAAQALENARLLDETRRRVDQERTLNDLSARFSRSLDVETVLQDAVRELGRLLSMDEVTLHIGVLDGENEPK